LTDEIIAFNPSKPEDGEYMASEVKSLDQLGFQILCPSKNSHLQGSQYLK
jgi:hypothetical protein